MEAVEEDGELLRVERAVAVLVDVGDDVVDVVHGDVLAEADEDLVELVDGDGAAVVLVDEVEDALVDELVLRLAVRLGLGLEAEGEELLRRRP